MSEAAVLRLLREVLGEEGCCCKPRDRRRTADGHTVTCRKVRVMVERLEARR